MKVTGLNEYQEQAMTTCTESSDNHLYMLTGLCEEVGELHGKFAKAIRKGLLKALIDNNFHTDGLEGTEVSQELIPEITKEIGDCLWMLAGICHTLGITLEDVANKNLAKLADRQKRNVIIGEGDNR